MTREEFHAFAAGVARAAKASHVDVDVVRTILKDPRCRHAFDDVLNPQSGTRELTRLFATVDGFDLDSQRGPARGTLFAKARRLDTPKPPQGRTTS
jgi:hypothetical protein